MASPSRSVLCAALVAGVVLAGVLPCSGSSDPAAAPTPMPPVATPDRALVERLFEETGAERELPTPSWTEYLSSLAETALG